MIPYELIKVKKFTGKLKLVKLVAKRAEKNNLGGSKVHVTIFSKPENIQGHLDI